MGRWMLVALLVGCGSSEVSDGPRVDAGADAGVDAVPDAVGVDAVPAPDAPPDAHPFVNVSCHCGAGSSPSQCSQSFDCGSVADGVCYRLCGFHASSVTGCDELADCP